MTILLVAVATLTTAAGQTIYTNDFESANLDGWSTAITNPTFQSPVQIETTRLTNQNFLGRFGNQAVNFSTGNIPEHDSITLEFDLLIIQTWDGNGTGLSGPDIWSLNVAGGSSLLYTSFSNSDSNRQSYPDSYPAGDHPAKAGASSTRGIDPTLRDVDYHIKVTFPHTATDLELQFAAELRDHIPTTQNEAWGIDNIKLTAVKTSPSFSLQVGEHTAEPGDTITVPIYMRDVVALQKAGVTGVGTSLRFNASLLFPLGSTPLGTLEGEDRVLPIVMPIGSANDSIVATLQFLVLLGSDTTTSLALEGSSTSGGYAVVREIPGRFTLTGGCTGGAMRYIVQQKSVMLKSLNLSLTSGTLEAVGIAEEAAWVQISAYDLNGHTVVMPSRHYVGEGEWRLSFGVQELASGLYFFVIETSSEHRTIGVAMER